MRNTLKSLCLTLVVLLAGGAAVADCGIKDTHKGTLKSVDAKANMVVVVDQNGEEIQLELTENSKITDTDGNETTAMKLVGEKVKVISEHAKIDSVEQLA